MINYQDKVAGCWIGKCLGGAIGMPFEGVPFRPCVNKDNVFLQDVPNDDLELQLIWLVAMNKYGITINYHDFGQTWLDYIPHGCDEYSIAERNLRHHIMPPESGIADNCFADGMGAAIRSEVWAVLFPNQPKVARHFAILDASVDHYGDGVLAEIFMAVAESLAFKENNIYKVLSDSRTYIDNDSRLAKAIDYIFELYDNKVPQQEAATLIMNRVAHHNFTDCVMNLSIIIYALLWGKNDFLESIILAINMGFDTDCTAASCGAFLGIIHGKKALPENLVKLVSDKLTVSDFVKNVPNVPLTLSDTIKLSCRLNEVFKNEVGSLELLTYQTPKNIKRPANLPVSKFLLLDSTVDNVDTIREYLLQKHKTPLICQDKIIEVSNLQFDLSKYAKEANTLHLFTILEVVETPPADGVCVSVTADVGLTLFFDNQQVVNHHSRRLSIPSFHRVEGGSSFVRNFKKGEKILVELKLYSCIAPLKCALVFGNKYNDYIESCLLKIEC